MFSVFFLLSYALKSEQRTFICTLNVLNLNTECDENKWVKKSFCEKSCNRDFDCKAQTPHRFNRTLKIKVNRLQGAPRARCTETWNRVVYNIHIQCVVYWMCMRVCAAHFDLKWFNTSHTASYTQTYTHTHTQWFKACCYIESVKHGTFTLQGIYRSPSLCFPNQMNIL